MSEGLVGGGASSGSFGVLNVLMQQQHARLKHRILMQRCAGIAHHTSNRRCHTRTCPGGPAGFDVLSGVGNTGVGRSHPVPHPGVVTPDSNMVQIQVNRPSNSFDLTIAMGPAFCISWT